MPPQAAPRRLPASQRKESIARAVLPVVARKGFDGVTTRELAAAAGVSEALLFRHFPSKEALSDQIYEYVTHSFELDYARIGKLAASTETLAKLVCFIVRGIVIKRAAEADTWQRLLYRSLVEDGRFVRKVFAGPLQIRLKRQFVAALEAARAAGDCETTATPPENLFWFMHHTASMVCLVRLADRPVLRYRGNLKSLVSDLSQFGLRGIGLNQAAMSRFGTSDQFELWLEDPESSLLAAL